METEGEGYVYLKSIVFGSEERKEYSELICFRFALVIATRRSHFWQYLEFEERITGSGNCGEESWVCGTDWTCKVGCVGQHLE